MMKYNVDEFYPTPKELLEKITVGIKWDHINTVLEPEAGKGDIVEYVKERCKMCYCNDIDIDCIEIDSDLRCTLSGKGYRVVHDDFLTFNTFKHYDLIIMNPPFSNGAAHLTKALDMQENGGGVICILNAETIRNQCTNERKTLAKRLDNIGAEITYMQEEFVEAERKTDVEIAVIKAYYPEPERESIIFENLKKKNYAENTYYDNITDLAPNDFIDAIVRKYNIEVESGVRLIQEYKAMCPHILTDMREDCSYNKPILDMKIGDGKLSVNKFVKCVRAKYWNALFRNPKFTGNMTSNLMKNYSSQVEELSNYDFSAYNIRYIQIEMSKNLIKGIEDCIIELFDKLSYQYSYSDELSNNIHYYNGWKTNKAWIINKKVILPYMNAFSSWSGKFDPDYEVKSKLKDIEKALNYLDGGLTECRDIDKALDQAKNTGQTKKIKLKYFYVTFYKKGTCHIEFTNDELLKKLNIFGSQQKGWLPPGYGKKTYQEMNQDERAVVDDFEGENSYHETVENAKYFIYDPKNSMPMIEDREVV